MELNTITIMKSMTVLSHRTHLPRTSFEHFIFAFSKKANTPYSNIKKQEEGLLSQELA